MYNIIDSKIVELLDEDPALILSQNITLPDGEVVPMEAAEPMDEPELLYNPSTGEEGWVATFNDKKSLLKQGWIEKED